MFKYILVTYMQLYAGMNSSVGSHSTESYTTLAECEGAKAAYIRMMEDHKIKDSGTIVKNIVWADCKAIFVDQ